MTNRCKQCQQPLVKERLLCGRCDGVFCPSCLHPLAGNQHGFDQNDGWMDGDKFVHSGRCTYCEICNPREALDEIAQANPQP